MKLNLKNYKEIRGTLVKKKQTVFGYRFYISDDNGATASITVGKGLFLDANYNVGNKLTVGYIGHKLINIRPGIVANED